MHTIDCVPVDQADPYGHLAGQHFNRVMKRYGAPVIMLNLVKVNFPLLLQVLFILFPKATKSARGTKTRLLNLPV